MLRVGRPRTSSRWNVTDAVVVRPLVRPAFLRWSIVVFVLLVPFVVHAIWDYAESSRLAKNIAAIRDNHQPVSAYAIDSRPVGGELAAAQRLYGGAAVLARSDEDESRKQLFARMENAAREDRWPEDLLTDMRRRVSEREDAFHLLDRAAILAFAGFAPGTSYNYRTSDLLGLAGLAALRTRLFAVEGRGDTSAQSLYSELRVARTLEPIWRMGAATRAMSSLATLINEAAPGMEALSRVDSALAELDRDDLLKNHLLYERATLVDNMNSRARQPAAEWIVRPWLLQTINRRLELLAFQIEAANRPWPRKLDAAKDMNSLGDPMWKRADDGRGDIIARALALIRCGRIVMAVSRYRGDERKLPGVLEDLVPRYLEAMPIDPFSGKPLRYTTRDGGYSVSSVGSNRAGGRDLALRIRAPGIQ
jgi:hypothetical protein